MSWSERIVSIFRNIPKLQNIQLHITNDGWCTPEEPASALQEDLRKGLLDDYPKLNPLLA